MYDPELLQDYKQFVLEHGVDVIEEGGELLEQVGLGLQQTAHAILYPVDTARALDELTGGPIDYEKMKQEAEARLQAEQAALVPELDIAPSSEELSTE
jgi:hypothetical protein